MYKQNKKKTKKNYKNKLKHNKIMHVSKLWTKFQEQLKSDPEQ